MRRIVLGTAGHIDHGKTALVKALAGYDADRLQEEKDRGITITLGFASFVTPAGDEIGIVDVPGHEKFIKTMISGAAGMDMIMLVIAADDGIMPQTKEHLDICSILRIKHGIIALTKSDLVDDDWLELVKSDIKKYVAGTFLEGAPVIPISSVTGEGIDALKAAISDTAKKVADRESPGYARMPTDRIFTMKGFGTVATGTLISGELSTGDEVELLPSGKTAKIRSLQQHGQKVDSVLSGSRVAANISALEKDDSLRGDMLVSKGTFTCERVFDVYLENVSAEKIVIKNQSRLRFLAYTKHTMAEIRLLSGKKIMPGGSGLARVYLDTPMPLTTDDKFIILGTSKIQTIGGGAILRPVTGKARKKRAAIIDELNMIKDSDTPGRALTFIKCAGERGMTLKELSLILNLHEKPLAKRLAKTLSDGVLVQFSSEPKSFVHIDSLIKVKENIVAKLTEFHADNPAKAGISKEELKEKAGNALPEKLFSYALKALEKDETLVIKEDIVLLKEFAGRVTDFSKKIKEDVVSIYKESGLTPPLLPELKKKLTNHDPRHIDDTLSQLLRDNVLIRISEGYYLHEDSFTRLKGELVLYLGEHNKIDAAGFKSITGASRKYTIPLLEKFDMLRITIRMKDNTRVLK